MFCARQEERMSCIRLASLSAALCSSRLGRAEVRRGNINFKSRLASCEGGGEKREAGAAKQSNAKQRNAKQSRKLLSRPPDCARSFANCATKTGMAPTLTPAFALALALPQFFQGSLFGQRTNETTAGHYRAGQSRARLCLAARSRAFAP